VQGLNQKGNRESRGPVFTIFDYTFQVRGAEPKIRVVAYMVCF